MSNYRIALRYDKSLLNLAIEQGVLEEVHQDMLLFDKTCRENRALALMLKNPVVGHQKKLSVLKAVFEGKVNKLTLRIFEVISLRNRENILPDVARIFHEQYNEHKGIVEATLISAAPVDDQQRKQFAAIVQKKTGAKEVKLHEQIDKNIIGGYILKIGDRQIDASIESRLKELEHQFAS